MRIADLQLAIDANLFLCVALVVWVLLPRRSGVVMLRLPGVPRPTTLLGEAPRQRLNPVALLLRRIGMVIPHGAWSEEFRMAPIYPGSSLSIEEFRGLKVLGSLGGCAVFLVLAAEFSLWSPVGFAVAALVGFVLPELWLRGRIRRRNRAILRLLPEVIDLLALCVGAGVDFLGALNRIIAMREYKQEPLVDELSMAIQEMKFGKRKAEALKAMARRVNLQELTSFVRAIVLADRMGTPIADVLNVHAEDVRMQRYNRAERAALTAPIKLLFPLIFCIMPCVAIIVAAPVYLQFARMNPFKMMGGH